MSVPDGEIDFLVRVLRDEAAAVAAVADRVTPDFCRAVGLLVRCAEQGGTVLVTGMGKSGHVGAKISASMASLGIPSHCVHPTEAAHGDLGKFRKQDVVLAISSSGETEEVVDLALTLRQDGLDIISITAIKRESPSSLERLATVPLTLGLVREAGEPEFLAPTSSTTATMALGDALVLAAARRREFTHEDFKRRHPGGSLGGLLRPVTDVLRFVAGRNMPLISETSTVAEALRQADIGGRRPGALILVNQELVMTGIFTDGDLRRLVLRGGSIDVPIKTVMTRSPRSLRDDALVKDAVQMIREFRQDEIPVVDQAGHPVGILDVQDLMTMKLVKD
jgi:arabinose-5-phosphate isomerase